MKARPSFALGEELTLEREWQWEGITVLTARAALPQLRGDTHREKRFDRYYAQLADAYFARCEQRLLPEAAASCREAMARSAPWSKTDAALVWWADAQTEEAMILSFALRRGGTLLREWTDGWDRRLLLPLTKAETKAALAAQ